MPDLHSAAQEINAILDRITQAGGDQQKVQQAVQEAKQKVQELVQHAGQGGQGAQQQGTTQRR